MVKQITKQNVRPRGKPHLKSNQTSSLYKIKAFFTTKMIIIISSIIVVGLAIGLSLYFFVFNNPGSTTTTTSGGGATTTTTSGGGATTTCAPPTIIKNLTTASIQQWGGWSSTTYFGGESPWPGGGSNPSIDLCGILNFGGGTQIGNINITTSGELIPVFGTMGGAIPWPIFASIFGWKSRTEYLSAVINSCNGTAPTKCCLIIQPINKFPTEIGPTTSTNSTFDMVNNLCSGTSCTDINDTNITATYNNGSKYPAYLVIPYEGCGGNCIGANDCVNNCSDVVNIVSNFNYYQNCKDSNGNLPPVPTDVCQSFDYISQGNFKMTSAIEQQYYTAGYDPFAISTQTQNGLNMLGAINANEKFVNYCSGKNMHIDLISGISQIPPLWSNLGDGVGDSNNSITLPSNGLEPRGGNIDTTMVRYMLVPGNIFGNFNILAAGTTIPSPIPTNVCPGGGGGGGGKCSVQGDDANICNQPACAYPQDCTNPELPNCNIPWSSCPSPT